MTTPCYEIVTYKVKDPQQADSARAIAQNMLKHFPGFIDWVAFSGMDSPTERVDLVMWNSHKDALAAAKAVESQPEFSSFRSSVKSLVNMGHYTAPLAQAARMGTGCGIEIGRFRLKPGVDESEMRSAYNLMVGTHLSLQQGWKSQHLVSLGNGVFVDLAFADDQQHAEAICASWQGQTACEAFLDLIEPVSMEFGSL
ncbi:hypothetical protein FCL49_02705 [Serratia proteamaculans]|uniref:hypothetical protein n=1 Tax=Serratia proteamaculans TaxID=28151 RepID=UPI0010765B36|nr:hypothetical protein [Serratia proteamaculans]NTX78753.1 hypothetical protein [Serratia proteamaculans]NTZ27006.1 hypothetical protein [Serratia proteamaculans]TFZ51111.1 hypothetical protein E5C26_12170 [Serratia proteamaculans]